MDVACAALINAWFDERTCVQCVYYGHVEILAEIHYSLLADILALDQI